MEIPLEIAVLIVLTTFITAKGIFRYNAKKRSLESKELKNEYKPKL